LDQASWTNSNALTTAKPKPFLTTNSEKWLLNNYPPIPHSEPLYLLDINIFTIIAYNSVCFISTCCHSILHPPFQRRWPLKGMVQEQSRQSIPSQLLVWHSQVCLPHPVGKCDAKDLLPTCLFGPMLSCLHCIGRMYTETTMTAHIFGFCRANV
jgi:hypothetical protein